ncbi:MAG TPA: S-methyl-5'-thioinosine phosphorylase, partial [Bacillota bacterium]|nr:S-methyl-5'-thioinosine phosphorylase [Bacillota bacterium]
MAKVELAIIGGSGFYEPGLFSDIREELVQTPYGEVVFTIGKLGETELAFLPRHGKEHSVLPHQLNYRANIRGLQELGIKRVITTTAVGSMNERFAPGSLVLIDQFLDFTKQRAMTFFDSGDVHRAHIDMTEPFCTEIRSSLMSAAKKCGITVFDGGCYVCTEGPRFETPAEIRAFKILGGDVAGMTAVPEVILARELGICYANISIITNWAAGINSQSLS